MKKTRAFLSILMAVFILFGSLPIGVTVAYAETIKISTVALTGVGIPRPGMNPNTQALPVGVGYSVDTSFNDSSRKNGITWVDNTENKIISSSNLSTYTFIEGHSYSVSIRVIANNGYEFAVDSGGNTALKATVNSNSANTYNIYNTSSKSIVNVGYSFGVCKNEVVSNAVITGVTPPKAGQAPAYSATVTDSKYSINTNYTGSNVKNGIYWWDKTTQTRVDSSNGTFLTGHEYMLQIAIKANTGYEFSTKSSGGTSLSATVNGNEAKVYGIMYQSAKEYVVVDYTFPVLENEVVSNVVITGVTPPKAGQAPAYSATVTDSKYSINTNYTGSNIKNGIYWWDKTTKTRVNSSNETFIAGHEYMFEVAIKANAGYEFSTKSSGGTSLSATVNGKEGKVYGIQNQSAKEYVVVDYTFPVLEKQQISDVSVINLPEPKAGEKPVYITSSIGSGYGVKKDFTTTGFKEGVRWVDLTGEGILEHEKDNTFIAGHSYRCDVMLEAKSDYEFTVNSSGTSSVSGTLNGKTAEVSGMSGYNKTEIIVVSYTFDELQNEVVSKADVTFVTAPQKGETPSYSVKTGDSSYSVKTDFPNVNGYNGGVRWFDLTDKVNLDSQNDIFKAGHVYMIDVILAANAGYEFDTNCTARVNGKSAETSKLDGFPKKETIRVTYTFDKLDNEQISEVSVTDASAPRAGEKPVYHAAVKGKGYFIDNSLNEWQNGGVYWFDITENTLIDSDDLFISGHEYRCSVLFAADSGYEFAVDSEGLSAVEATLNGKKAEAAKISGHDAKEYIAVMYDFGECKEENVFTVDFDANGQGAAPESQKVESGKSAKQPDDLKADGYNFLGWYTEPECTNKYDFTKEVTADITLFANWEKAQENPDPTIDRVYGDLDNDGKISSADSLMILRASVKLEELSELETKLADVDGDEVITASDALEVLRYSVKLPSNSKTGEKY